MHPYAIEQLAREHVGELHAMAAQPRRATPARRRVRLAVGNLLVGVGLRLLAVPEPGPPRRAW